ncbi:vacuolar protein sorting-associated protein 27 [Ceratobasidium sp. AG-Ba]|nr:vacuolar protein sorting-associated protein 27 [Ceratobasidium sp. AG-Ba]QRV91727.1 vacuolar protein sorting-associated protein 27 [Ceratobasidium sp. AG-Ba]
MASYFWGGSSVFDEAVEKATSELLPSGSEDIALSLEICDQIRSKSVQPREAMRSIKRRLDHKNPNVQLLALGLTDVCIKNGGDHFLEQVASREFMDNLVSILKQPALNFEVKNKMLKLIQNWSLAFEQKPALGYVSEVYKSLKNQGFKFPTPDTSAKAKALLATRTAPEWIDSDVTIVETAAKFSTNNVPPVHQRSLILGLHKSARSPSRGDSKVSRSHSHSHSHSHSRKDSRRPHRAGEDTMDSDLQRAIALSLAEAQANANGYSDRPGYVPAARSEPPLAEYGEEDADLKAAIEASLREAQAPQASAPAPIEPVQETPRWSAPKLPQYDLDPREEDAILSFNQAVEQAGTQGHIPPQTADMYERASVLRPKLVRSLDDTGRKEHMLSEMHDKLSQAVKLYDKLLTEQVERASWRYQSAYAQSPAQQYGPPQQYGQPQQYAPPPQQYGQPQQYAPPPQQPVDQASHQAYAPQPPMQQAAPVPPAPQQYPSAPSAYPTAPPATQYPAAPQPAYPSAPTPSTSYPSAPTTNAYPSAPTPNSYAVPAAPYSPPPVQYSPPVSRSPTLQRQGTMSSQHGPVGITAQITGPQQSARPTSMYATQQGVQQPATSSSYPPQPYQNLGTPQPAPSQPYQSQPYQATSPSHPYTSPAPASALPNLPNVPPMLPNAPQGFPQSQYGVEKTEQKEAMLISFD